LCVIAQYSLPLIALAAMRSSASIPMALADPRPVEC
jgi:hypothetical protein